MYNIQVVNTYFSAVTYQLWLRSTTGGPPIPTPLLPIPPTTIQTPVSGDTASIMINYTDRSGTPQSISVIYGAPFNYSRNLNVMWNSGGDTQVIVLVDTSVTDPGPGTEEASTSQEQS